MLIIVQCEKHKFYWDWKSALWRRHISFGPVVVVFWGEEAEMRRAGYTHIFYKCLTCYYNFGSFVVGASTVCHMSVRQQKWTREFVEFQIVANWNICSFIRAITKKRLGTDLNSMTGHVPSTLCIDIASELHVGDTHLPFPSFHILIKVLKCICISSHVFESKQKTECIQTLTQQNTSGTKNGQMYLRKSFRAKWAHYLHGTIVEFSQQFRCCCCSKDNSLSASWTFAVYSFTQSKVTWIISHASSISLHNADMLAHPQSDSIPQKGKFVPILLFSSFVSHSSPIVEDILTKRFDFFKTSSSL